MSTLGSDPVDPADATDPSGAKDDERPRPADSAEQLSKPPATPREGEVQGSDSPGNQSTTSGVPPRTATPSSGSTDSESHRALAERAEEPSKPTFGQPGRLTASQPQATEAAPDSAGSEADATPPTPPVQSEEAVEPEQAAARPVTHSKPRVMAVANQKGGVGKTTTAVNFGAAAAELGHRVLIVDLDPQGNASTGLGINPRSLNASMYDVLLHDVPIDEAIEAAEVRNLFVAPANLDLAGAEIELVPAFSRELRLKNALATVADDFDLVLIDCPPSLGLLTVNAFAAATEVMVPIQCEYYALEGLGQLLRNVDLVKRNLNASLELSAIVLVMYDARTNLAAQVAGEVREHFGSKVCRAVIPRNIRLSEAPSFGQPITVFDPSSRGAIAYRDLAKEVAGEPS